jgi:curved DNA-binding protein CbpA
MGFEEADRIIHSQPRSPREILGVGVNSSWSAITKAYRMKAMECHPDRMALTGMTKEGAEEAFRIVRAAYGVLTSECEQGRKASPRNRD